MLGVKRLLALALNKEDPASKLAGKVLAYVEALIAADGEKLSKANEGYQQERTELGKLLRNDLWFPRGPLYQALHRELWHCWFYRGELHCPLVQPKWGAEEYRWFINLPPLSPKSLPDWEPKLWLLLKQHNPGLLEELRHDSSRQESVWTYSDGSSQQQVKSRRLFWKDFRPQFRNHLTAVAERQG
jgi:hypothetical protein